MNDKKGKKSSPLPRVLFVDDDKITVDVVKRLLKNKYVVDSVNNGEDALKIAEENEYDAFLIDIGLPGNMNGIQTVKELKKNKDNHNKPYIAITAYALAGNREYFLSEGLTHYISKPFEFKNLMDLIESALEKSKGRPVNKQKAQEKN